MESLNTKFKNRVNFYVEKYIKDTRQTSQTEANGKSIHEATVVFKSMDDADRVKTAYSISPVARQLLKYFGNKKAKDELQMRHFFGKWPNIIAAQSIENNKWPNIVYNCPYERCKWRLYFTILILTFLSLCVILFGFFDQYYHNPAMLPFRVPTIKHCNTEF